MNKGRGKRSSRLKPTLIITGAVIVWIAIFALISVRYTLIGGKLINKKTESLDMSGKNVNISSLTKLSSLKKLILLDSDVSLEEYKKLTDALPECYIRWSVPLSSGRYDNESTEISIASIEESDIERFALFDNLKKINAEGIPDWQLLSKLEYKYADIDVDWGVEIAGKYYSPDLTELMLPANINADELMEKLQIFSGLKKVIVGGNDLSVDKQLALIRKYPYLDFNWTVDISSDSFDNKVTAMDFKGNNSIDLAQLIRCAPLFNDLESIDFSGCDYSNIEMKEVAEAFPEAEVLWQFTIYGQEISSVTEEIDFSGIKIEDTSEIENALPYLKNLKKVIMSDCGISDEDMDALNKRHDNVKFVWTVYFSHYQLRTDTTVFIASYYNGAADNPRDLTDENIWPLKYCTDMVALDLGHMYFSNVEFCSEMKDLKWLIIAMSRVRDISPLANCKELYYIEMFLCPVEDLSPLLECKKLRHLNICQCNTGGCLEVLAQMTWLERCWMSGGGTFDDRLDREYVYSDEFLPHTMKRLRGLDHTGDGWRNYPAYFEMRDAFDAPYYPTFWSSNEWRNNPNVVVPEGFIEEHGLDETG